MSITTDRPEVVTVPEFVPDWQPGEGDVVWQVKYQAPTPICKRLWNESKAWTKLSVYLSESGSVRHVLRICPDAVNIRPYQSTIDQAKDTARAHGRSFVVLLDDDGREIERYPV